MTSSYQSNFLQFYNTTESTGEIPHPNQFQSVVINPRQVLIRWGFPESTGSSFNINNYSFTILRSHAEEENYQEVSSPMTGIYEWLDQPQSLQSRWRRIFYKLKIVHVPSSQELTVGPISMHEAHTPSRIALRIIKDLNMLLEKFPVGIVAFAFQSRQEGGRCDCYDYVEQMADPNCGECAGTGWSYPFAKVPIKFNLSLNADVEQVQLQDGEKEGDERSGWTTNYPDFKKRDCIYVPAKRMVYRVIGKQWLAQENAIVGIKQALRLTPVNYDSAEYCQLNLSNNLNEIRDYLDVTWDKGNKTYFGCRTGRPLQPLNRRGS